ncbi:MAG: hypothetical protein ACREXX_05710 [Gammaproteobacteria bacterium]
MKSQATSSFWKGYFSLPQDIQELAVKQYRLWLQDPHHPSLHFKKAHDYWSARVTDDYRVLGVMEKDTVVWFWIGTHVEYSRLLHKK